MLVNLASIFGLVLAPLLAETDPQLAILQLALIYHINDTQT